MGISTVISGITGATAETAGLMAAATRIIEENARKRPHRRFTGVV
jgi:hypothetical protein